MKQCIAILVLVVVSSLATSVAHGQPFGRRPGRLPPSSWRPYRPLPPPRSVYPYNVYPYSYGSYYTYPNYSYATPLYSTPTYSTPTYSTPSIDYSASSVAANAVPVPSAANFDTFTLTNPRQNGGSIRYSLNNYSYTMNPGESQTVPLDRDWVISFDSGFNRTLRYRMEPGRYEFTVSPEAGWNVLRHVPAVPAGPSVR